MSIWPAPQPRQEARQLNVPEAGEITLPHPLTLFAGGTIQRVTIRYESWGRLGPNADNAILVFTGLSPDAHARSTQSDPRQGWWEEMIGPGCALDTDRFFVICINNLGSCFGSTGPASIDPTTGSPYALSFPEIRIEDLAAAAHLMLSQLGIHRLHGLVGPSMGGMTALAFALRYPDAVERVSLISSAARPEAFAVAVHSLQREAIRNDPDWRAGRYAPDARPLTGMRLARKIGMTSYRSAAELDARFASKRSQLVQQSPFGLEFEVEYYLENRTEAFVQRFDPNCYLYLSRAMDLFDASAHGDDLVDALRASSARSFQVIGVDSDSLFPMRQQQELARSLLEAGHQVNFVQTKSAKGHDAFLTETEVFSPLLRTFLA